MSKKIIWQKYADPFIFDVNALSPASPLLDSDEDTDDYFTQFEKEKYQRDGMKPTFINNVKIIQTPGGLYPLPEESFPSKCYNLWIGHTNFNITREIVKILNEIDGVETLRPVTRYRFEVGIGLTFSSIEVKKRITDVLCGTIEKKVAEIAAAVKLVNPEMTPELRDKVIGTIGQIKSPHWAVFMLPNGETQVLTTPTLTEDFYDKLVTWSTTQILVGGVIYVKSV